MLKNETLASITVS